MFTLSPFLFCLSDSCSPQIDPHFISSMAFTITLGFSEFNVATFIGVFLCSSLQASVSEPQGDQFCSISNSLENRREYRGKQKPIPWQLPAALFCSQDSISRCEWIQSHALSSVLRIPSHTPRTLYPPDMCSAAFLS